MRKLFIGLVLLTLAVFVWDGIYAASDVDGSSVEAIVPLGGGLTMTLGYIVILGDSYSNGYLMVEAEDVGLSTIGHLVLTEYDIVASNLYQGGFIIDIDSQDPSNNSFADSAMAIELFIPDSTSESDGVDGLVEVDSVGTFYAKFQAFSR